MSEVELEITALAAGGDGVARDLGGRVTFVPRTAPGDRVRVKLVKETKSFARGELLEVLSASPSRVTPPCAYFIAGCGGCQWQHVARATQLDAKQAIVIGALRKIEGLIIERIADPAPDYGWRRRARFHVVGGKVGLYATGSHRLIEIGLPHRADAPQPNLDAALVGAHCPQLEPALDAALRLVATTSPPDGELALVRGHAGDIAVAVEKPWRGAEKLVGRAHIRGVVAGDRVYGAPVIEIEPGLYGGPLDFAQASAAGNKAMIELTRSALGRGPGRLLELHAGAGNFTRGFVADGWDVLATDAVAPPKPVAGAKFEVGSTQRVMRTVVGPFDAVVLDPPRTGAADALDGIVQYRPKTVVYVSCDPATLARDVTRLVETGFRAERAWPFDLMPQTAHVEVVMKLVRA